MKQKRKKQTNIAKFKRFLKDKLNKFKGDREKIANNIKKSIELLEKGTVEEKINALKVLGKVGKGDKKVIDALVKSLAEEDWQIREMAVKALTKQGDLGYALAGAYDKFWFDSLLKNYKKAVKIAKSLEGEEREELIKYLTGEYFIGSNRANVRKYVITFIEEANLRDKRISKALVNSLWDEVKEIKKRAARALEQLEKNNKGIIKDLIKVLNNEEIIKVYKVLMRQGDLGYVLAAAWDRNWFNKLKGDYKKAIEIAKSLEGEEREELIKYLTGEYFIKSKHENVRSNSIRFIRNAELKDERIFNVLVKAFDEFLEDRGEIQRALMKQGDLGYVLAAAWDKEWFEEFGGNYEKAIWIAELLKGKEQKKLINYLIKNLIKFGQTENKESIEIFIDKLKFENEEIKHKIGLWKLFIKGLEKCNSSEVRVIKELL